MKDNGIHRGTPGAEVIDRYMGNIDYFEWVKIFYALKRHSEVSQLIEDSDADSTIIEKTCKELQENLIVGLEPRSLSGSLVDLIFEQNFVARWMKQYSTQPQQIDLLLEEICPGLQQYFTQLLELAKKVNAAHLPHLEEGILRVQFVLAILLGHKSQNHLETVKDLGIKSNVCFTLPRITVVSPKQFHQLLCSEVVLSNANLGWDENFVKAMRQERNNLVSNDGSENSSSITVERLVQNFSQQVTQFVHFACNGPASALSSAPKPGQELEIDPVSHTDVTGIPNRAKRIR